MPELTVAEFSYLAVIDPKRKKGKARKYKNKGEYRPYKDYYRPLREKIKGLFKHNRTFKDLRSYAEGVDEKKRSNYKAIALSFIKWAEGKNIYHYDPKVGFYAVSSTRVRCNPELFYKVNGEDRLIKLHFSGAERMSQRRANYICFLVSESCDVPVESCRVLDLKERKEYRFNGFGEDYADLVLAEALRIEADWEEV